MKLWTEQDENQLNELISKKDFYNKHKQKIQVIEAIANTANIHPGDVIFGTATQYNDSFMVHITLHKDALKCYNSIRKLQS